MMNEQRDTIPTSPWYGYEGGASALGDALRELRMLEEQYDQYDYDPPPRLREDISNAARRVRNAARFLMSDAADQP